MVLIEWGFKAQLALVESPSYCVETDQFSTRPVIGGARHERAACEHGDKARTPSTDHVCEMKFVQDPIAVCIFTAAPTLDLEAFSTKRHKPYGIAAPLMRRVHSGIVSQPNAEFCSRGAWLCDFRALMLTFHSSPARRLIS